MQNFIYADNAATTPLSEAAFEAMKPYLTSKYGNPSGVYRPARESKRAVDLAREEVARAINASPGEIFFTGSGTEANNWAIKCICEAKGPGHIITSAIEHHAVLNVCEWLEDRGFDVTYLPVDSLGRVSVEDIFGALRDDTLIVSVMTLNNEIGTIQPIADIGALCRERGVVFHTDAVQAVGHVPVDVKAMNIDLLSMSAHKFGGPKGVGALYCRKLIELPSFIHGGGQEKGLRSGTENVAGIVGMAAACEAAVANMAEVSKHVSALRRRLTDGVLKIPYSHLTGDPDNRSPAIASFVFECATGEAMVMELDRASICASSGSACSTGSPGASHVLLAVGLDEALAHGSLRFSLSENSTEADIERILTELPASVAEARRLSPFWDAAAERPVG